MPDTSIPADSDRTVLLAMRLLHDLFEEVDLAMTYGPASKDDKVKWSWGEAATPLMVYVKLVQLLVRLYPLHRDLVRKAGETEVQPVSAEEMAIIRRYLELKEAGPDTAA